MISMKIARDYVVKQASIDIYEEAPEKSMHLVATPADDEQARTTIMIDTKESSVGQLALPPVTELVGRKLHFEIMSGPVTEAEASPKQFAIKFVQIYKMRAFDVEDLERCSADLHTAADEPGVSKIRFSIQLELSAEEYAEMDKLGKDQRDFSVSVKLVV